MDGIIGEIRVFAGNVVPQGWELCNGQSLPVDQNKALYALLGNTYGGDEKSFNLPNLNGRVIAHFGAGPGFADYQVGQTIGTEAVALTTSNLPQHTHTMNVAAIPAVYNKADGNYMAGMIDANDGGANTVTSYLPGNITPKLVQLSQATVSRTGNNAPHENRQPYLVLTYLISVAGEFPQFP